ncbi:hypothetical protein CHS0354_043088 [Potamilus streckersoni]|uniref:Uncharacterized protein n=1 Tax=Potamilus streckersoni TaxID=2493646 RepID=A0AAE0SCY2_9BIVA|nr:hypothetical protein CHS0354_043088 [Potamilus streckersoni]
MAIRALKDIGYKCFAVQPVLRPDLYSDAKMHSTEICYRFTYVTNTRPRSCELFITKMNTAKRSSKAASEKKGGGEVEKFFELGQTIQRLVLSVYLGCPPDIRGWLAKDYFLGAVQDKNLKLEIWLHRPNSLQEAIIIGIVDTIRSINRVTQGDQVYNVGIVMIWDNERRRKIDRQKVDLKKIGNTRNPKPVRYLNEEPGLYTQCLINGIELALLTDTGAAVSINSKRRYEALGHRKPKLSHGLKLPCYLAGPLRCNRITLDKNIRVPAEREVITRGWMVNVGCGKLATESVIEPLSSFRHETKIIVARAVVQKMDGIVPIRLLNPTKEVINLQAGVYCAEASAALSTQNVDRLRQDSNGSLPSYLSELFKRSSDQLTPEQTYAQCQQLSEFRKVFAKDDGDLAEQT